MRRLAALALALAFVLAPSAAAASFTFSVLTGSPVTAPGVTLNGLDQTQSFGIDTRIDYTGGGNTLGWKIQGSATTPASGGNTLPALQVSAGSFACIANCTTSPSNSVTYPVTLSGSAQRIYNAAANTGRGRYRMTSTFVVTYPSNVFPGTYSATITLAGATGP